ncbi:hypothetical protein I4U23_013281 [Adineta vaga]|nr:hypothetical protein I4U23_013281 [Adineta vaga]
MAYLLNLLSFLLVVTLFSHISASDSLYLVTFVPCNANSTCPQGNPANISQTFALNGTLNGNVTASVGEKITFILRTDVPEDPFIVCQLSKEPDFCSGIGFNNQFNTPINSTNHTTSVIFTKPGIYYYGSLKNPGMGGRITVFASLNTKSGSITATNTGVHNQFSTTMLLITIISLFGGIISN